MKIAFDIFTGLLAAFLLPYSIGVAGAIFITMDPGMWNPEVWTKQGRAVMFMVAILCWGVLLLLYAKEVFRGTNGR